MLRAGPSIRAESLSTRSQSPSTSLSSSTYPCYFDGISVWGIKPFCISWSLSRQYWHPTQLYLFRRAQLGSLRSKRAMKLLNSRFPPPAYRVLICSYDQKSDSTGLTKDTAGVSSLPWAWAQLAQMKAALLTDTCVICCSGSWQSAHTLLDSIYSIFCSSRCISMTFIILFLFIIILLKH